MTKRLTVMELNYCESAPVNTYERCKKLTR